MTPPALSGGLFWLAVILGITAGFFVLMRKLAKRRAVEQVSANELLAEFRELHGRGGLSDEEFQTIRAKLGPQIQLEAAESGVGSSMAEAATAMRNAAELLAGQHVGDRSGGSDDAGREGQEGSSDAVDRAAGEGCDATPPDGGDSMEGRR